MTKDNRMTLLAAILSLLWVFVLGLSSDSIGVPRDESFYIQAADFAASWFEDLGTDPSRALKKSHIYRRDKFGWNWEHPALMKSLFGVSKRILHDRLGLVSSPLLAYRLPTMLLAGFGLFLTFLLGRRAKNTTVGFLSMGFLAFMPRVFFHSHLACFDLPVTTLWIAIVYGFVRARTDRRWIWFSGVFLGLGFATKLNIFFLPFVLLFVAVGDVYLQKRSGLLELRPKIVRYAMIALSFLFIGGAVFFVHWPLLYHDPLSQLTRYIQFHARHVHYPVDYFGTLLYSPPFPVHLPTVMTLISVPFMTLVLAVVGGWFALRRILDARSTQWNEDGVISLVLWVNVLVPILIISLPNTPVFGGTKHWMPAMPFLAILAGLGLDRFLANVPSRLPMRISKVALVAWVFAIPIWGTYTYGSQGPAYYNAVVGGPPGAAGWGMSRNFWGHSTRAILNEVNTRTSGGSLVFWHKATQRSIKTYETEGSLSPGRQYTGDWTAPYSDWAVYHHQQEKLPEEVDIWRAYKTWLPVGGSYVDGLPIMTLYERPQSPQPN